MTTWTSAKEYLCKHYPTARDHGESVSLAWKGEDPGVGTVKLRVTAVDRADPCVVVTAELFGEHRLGLREVVEINEKVVIGGIALAGESYVLRQVLPLAELPPASLARTLGLVARTAAQLRRLVAPRPAHPELFANYAC